MSDVFGPLCISLIFLGISSCTILQTKYQTKVQIEEIRYKQSKLKCKENK